jgi:hypothetical protein
MKKCYIFGYGSLINSYSRAVTGMSGDGIPVRVKGVKRSWVAVSKKYPMAAVGIEPDPDSYCNGVVFSIDEKELSKFDLRERGYRRVILPKSQIEFLTSDHLIDEDVWIYFVNRLNDPCKNHPIAQSYVDVIIEGCMEISKEFTEEFFQLTFGWKYTWVDDRQEPRYPRHALNTISIQTIDQLIQQYMPDRDRLAN